VSDGNHVMIPYTDLSALLAITAWAAREHGDTLPDALLAPAGDVLARYDVHLEMARRLAAEVWIVLAENRHGEIDVLPFSAEGPAVRYARTRAGYDGISGEELAGALYEEGLVLIIPHGEGCTRFRVVRRTMDAGQP
jgi:hypothetical protein